MKQAVVAQRFCGSGAHDEQASGEKDHLNQSPLMDELAISPVAGGARPNFNLIFDSFAESAGIEIFSIQRHSALKSVVQAIHAHRQTIQETQKWTQPEFHLSSPMLHDMLDKTLHQPQLSDAASGVWSSVFDHPVLECNATDKLSRAEFNLLDETGCFRVPQGDYLAPFVREYFLYIHHMLPILDETDFRWALTKAAFSSPRLERASVFLLQAILSASCVVSLDTILFDVLRSSFCILPADALSNSR